MDNSGIPYDQRDIFEKFPFLSSAKTVSPSWGNIVVNYCMGGGGIRVWCVCFDITVVICLHLILTI